MTGLTTLRPASDYVMKSFSIPNKTLLDMLPFLLSTLIDKNSNENQTFIVPQDDWVFSLYIKDWLQILFVGLRRAKEMRRNAMMAILLTSGVVVSRDLITLVTYTVRSLYLTTLSSNHLRCRTSSLVL